MSFLKFFRLRSALKRPIRRSRLKLESLEERTVPAVIVPISGNLQAQLTASIAGEVGGVNVVGPNMTQSGSLAATAVALQNAGSATPTTLDSVALQGSITDTSGPASNRNAGTISAQAALTASGIVDQTTAPQYSTALSFLYALSGTNSNLLQSNPLSSSATLQGQNLVFQIQADPSSNLTLGQPVEVNFSSGGTSSNPAPAGTTLTFTTAVQNGSVTVPVAGTGTSTNSGSFLTTVGSTFVVQWSAKLSGTTTLPSGQIVDPGTGLALNLSVVPLVQTSPTVSVTTIGGTYTGSPATATVTVNGTSQVEGVTPTLTYYTGTYTTASSLAGLTPLNGPPRDVGTYSVLAVFPGSFSYSSTSTVANFTITAASTTTTLVTSNSSTTYGQGVTFTALVTNSQTTVAPRGSVLFYDGATLLGQGTATNSGSYTTSWSYSTTAFQIGTHYIQAVYTTDTTGDFVGSTSNTVSQSIGQGTPAFTNLISPTITYGTSSVLLSGRLTNASTPAAGELITVTLNGTPTTTQLTGNGTFSTAVTTSGMAMGTYTISYSYGGDTNLTVATGSSVLNIQKATTTFGSLTAVTVTPGTSTVTITGQLTGALTPPAGENVTVTLNGVPTTTQITATGTFSASVNTASLAVGTYTIGYTYAGDTNFNTATASSVLSVQKTTVTFTSLGAPSIVPGTSTVTLTGQLTGTSTPPAGELVALTLNGVRTTAQVTATGSFSATFTTASLAEGTYTVSYSYGGDTTFNTATGSSVLTVQKATSTFASLSSPTITYGASSVTISGQIGTATVNPAGEVVTITLNGNQQSVKIAANGTFSTMFSAGALAAKTYTIGFAYGGDTKFAAATGSGTLTVQKATVAFSSLSAPTIRQSLHGKVTLTGTLSGAMLPPAGTVVTIVVNGMLSTNKVNATGYLTLSASVDSKGNFTITFLPTSYMPATYDLSYSYGGNVNFNTATGTSKLTITK